MTAAGRTGSNVPIGLVYNSQNWRQDNGVNWQLGSDTGYGFGWRMAIGSITPYYANWTAGVDHYIFTDGTGAEYRLDVRHSDTHEQSGIFGIGATFGLHLNFAAHFHSEIIQPAERQD